MKTIQGKTFKNESVEIDGKGFVGCSFTKCNLIYRATAPFGFDAATLGKMNGVTLEFLDGAALTLQALAQLHRVGPPFSTWVEHEFLRNGIPIKGLTH